MNVITPKPLRKGDLIAIIPTARAINAEELKDGIALAESWGLRVRLGAGIGRKHFQQAGTDKERAADLQAVINDPEVRAIWCARGGYGTIHLMDKVDLKPLLKNPKWIVGFSDVTVLHNALHDLGVASLHAQMPFMIAKKTEACRETLRAALFGEAEEISYQFDTAGTKDALTRTGEATGQLVGGNLSILYALRGSQLDIDPAGKILYLEDLDELNYHLDRMLQNLKYSGWFKNLAGLVIGHMTDMHDKNDEDPFGQTAHAMIKAAMGDVNYPVCSGFPAGHDADNRAIIMGQKAKLSVTNEGATLSFILKSLKA
ncbi:MAG: LD-carboxypeptidase [Flavobacteriales bacterium]|nr:LD-carboxypeptidase [Flavobacteriales bacterium]MBK6944065.1 LD-carboxypeptidase [Flavobacteriales bacterium]MBK7240269.1 LD-carboxypeptidase [Flavobacteriales bacterium]MBK9533733.1 LD-carboxypeptidase [Flavobacteriales bacterium]MBP9137020.1 LD-carboxypeptidase [Flavobacteriales bacterium]